jgi:hypothetical protein
VGGANTVLSSDGTDVSWVASGYPPLYRWGLATTVEGTKDAISDINVAVGGCRNIADDADVNLTTTITKQIDATWAEGDDAGGLFSGSVAATTWYFLFLITKDSDGTVDVGFDINTSGSNVPSGWTIERFLCHILTRADSKIEDFIFRAPNFFRLLDPIKDVDDSSGTSGTFESGVLSCPPEAIAVVYGFGKSDSGDSVGLLLRTPTADDAGEFEAVAYVRPFAFDAHNDVIGGRQQVYVDASSTVEYTLLIATWDTVTISTLAWYDTRILKE